jgi:ribosomal protein S12 methylthiotransferase accessory factor
MTTVGGRLLGFKRHLQAAVIPGEAAYLVSARGVTALRGRPIEILAPLLDGSRTFEDIVRDAAPGLRADQVGSLLGRLAEADVVAFRDADPEACEPDAEGAPARAYWDLAGLDGAAAARAVAATPVELYVVGTVDLDPLQAALRGSGLTVAAGPAQAGQAALTVVLCEDYLDPGLAEICGTLRAAGRPWLLTKPTGPEPWIGPFFQHETGPCWACLAHRLGELRRPELRARRALAGRRLPEASIAAARSVAAQLIVLEAAKWLAGVREANQSTIYTLDTLTLAGRHHPLTRRPQCPVCGDPALTAEQARRPIVPQPRPRSDRDGQRALTDEEVYDRYRHLVDPVTGLVGELVAAERTAGDSVHRCVATTSVYVYGDGPRGPESLLRMVSGGRGSTAVQARVGALGEAVERYSSLRHGDESVLRASYADLGPRALHPDACQLFDPRQFADRQRWNRLHGAGHWVPQPFEEHAPREWTPVWSLTGQHQRLLPTALLYLHHGRPGACTEMYADSNGNAAGASLEDAIAGAFLELVERDAVALWWYNRTRQPGVDLDAFADPWIERIRSAARESGRSVWALELTTDLGVPAFAAISARLGAGRPRPRAGFGAHFDPRVALRRAMAELGQVGVDIEAAQGTAPGPCGAHGSRTDPDEVAAAGLPAYVLPAPGPRSGPPVAPYRAAADLGQEVHGIVELLRGRGLELFALDLTRPDIGMPVVKVLVPGLRPMRARFAPGRLFDVPVALGRLAEPTRYEQLNPVPLPV